MDDKIIVTNKSGLTTKYGPAGLATITKALKNLIAADAKRGLKDRLVFLDNPATMKSFGGPVVTSHLSPRQNKAAIDAIFRKANPEYLLIVGAPDVVPHQDMDSPPADDPDQCAYGDLPYACNAPYSRDVAKFKGPTRVVGRLPDLTGAREPSHLISLIQHAAKHQPRDATEYGAYFGLSTDSWQESTRESLFAIFGDSGALAIVPPKGPKHPQKALGKLAHFINCHGGMADPKFYGEKDNAMPPSLTSGTIAKKIQPGTVAAVECCFGAELYDSVTLDLPLPICQQYLAHGAYGYFGSSTIAYGPAVGNGAADLITQYFLLAVIGGASLGRAALVARQQYIEQVGELDPIDLKTLAQFNLLGDPSVHPVKSASPTAVPLGITANDAKRLDRLGRRAKLRAEGAKLEATKPTASQKARGGRRTPTVKRALANIAKEAGIDGEKAFTAYTVKTPKAAKALASKAAPIASRYYVAVYRPERANSLIVAAVAKEVDGRIVGYRIYSEKS